MKFFFVNLITILTLFIFSEKTFAQTVQTTPTPDVQEIEQADAEKLRPNVTNYLQYLKNELQVTDEASSQSEVSAAYIRHNANRVRALRQFAVKLAREIDGDYLPELQAVNAKELRLIFPDKLPKISELKIGATYNFAFRFLGTARSIETFYIFARLNPFEEQAARDKLLEKPENAKIEENKETSKPKNEPKAENSSNAKPMEKPLTREMILKTAEEKKKEIFVKKNP